MASKTIRPSDGPSQSLDVDDDVALLAAARVAAVADRLGGVAARRGDGGQRVGDLLLVGAALGRAALGLLGDRLVLLLLGLQRGDLRLQGVDRLVHRDQVLLLELRRALDRADRRLLELRERVALVRGGELLAERLAMARRAAR